MTEEKNKGREKHGGGLALLQEKPAAMAAEPPAAQEEPEREYPAALLTHGDVCRNPGVFIEALRRLHSAMGTKFMIPVIGGKELNLHRLYVEVTERGGLEKVIMERRWREVIAVFNFPPTTTSASFVLRKYYLSLLHHFEQVYFFSARGPLVPPAAALQTRASLGKLTDTALPEKMPSQPPPPAILPGEYSVSECYKKQFLRSEGSQRFINGRKRSAACQIFRLPESSSLPATGRQEDVDWELPPRGGDSNGHDGACSLPPPDGSIPAAAGSRTYNFTVSGTIDGKFENGYFVTVKIGSQLLHGVLYHIHQLQRPSTPLSSSFSSAIVPYIPATRSVGRRRRLMARDPARPKPNRSAYNFFFSEKHSKLKAQFPHMEREYSKMIGFSWSKLTDEERQVFEDYGRRDKERYRRELQVYKERLKFAEPREVMRAEEMAREMEKASVGG